MPTKNYLKLGQIECYVRSYKLSNYVWDIVNGWEWFAKQTVGSQFVRAVDSISANIAEGFGRYHKKDKIRFYRVAYGSLFECFDWNQKAYTRTLLTQEEHRHILSELNILKKEINQLVKFTNLRLKE